MFNDSVIIDTLIEHIEKAVKATVKDLNDHYIEQEPPFTDRLISNIQNEIDGVKTKGVRWRAKTFSDRGLNSEESIIGADFMSVLDVDANEVKYKKGFLAQAKLNRSNNNKISNWKKVQEQCEKMLVYSPDSFLVDYSHTGIDVYPALSVIGSGANKNLQKKTFSDFFRLYLECFIGDRRLIHPDFEDLIKYFGQKPNFGPPNILWIQARDDDGGNNRPKQKSANYYKSNVNTVEDEDNEKEESHVRFDFERRLEGPQAY